MSYQDPSDGNPGSPIVGFAVLFILTMFTIGYMNALAIRGGRDPRVREHRPLAPEPEQPCRETFELTVGRYDVAAITQNIYELPATCFRITADPEGCALRGVAVTVAEAWHNPSATLLADAPLEQAGQSLLGDRVYAAVIKTQDLPATVRLSIANWNPEQALTATSVMVSAHLVFEINPPSLRAATISPALP